MMMMMMNMMNWKHVNVLMNVMRAPFAMILARISRVELVPERELWQMQRMKPSSNLIMLAHHYHLRVPPTTGIDETTRITDGIRFVK